MNLSKEHILALKISILLLVFAVFISYFVGYFNHIDYGIGDNAGGGKNYGEGKNAGPGVGGYNRYTVFIILSFVVYFISYFLAKLTIKPIENHNIKLKEYNHNLAHELKTPISVIKSNLELLELGYDKKLIKSSSDEIDLMSNIIDSLLFLSNKNELSSGEKIDLAILFEDNIKKLSKNINFKSATKKTIVNGDIGLINSLIRNLLENALKYGKNNTKIDVELTSKYFIIKNKLDKKFKNDDLEKLFDTFYQVDSSRYSSGYGLGLSIVKKICDIHNFKVKLSAGKDDFIVKVIF